VSKIKLDLAYAKYKDARGNYINNPVSGIVSGDTTAELYMTFEHVPVAFITVNKATVNIHRESSHTTNYIYYGALINVASSTSKPELANETLLPVSVYDVDFIDSKTIYLSGDITPYLRYGIGFKGRDNGKTCTIYANSPDYKPYLELDYSVNYTASAKNIKVEHTDITQPTMIRWQTDLEQVRYELQVVQGENVVFSTTGASAQSVSIPANTLLPGLDVIVKVRVTERLLNTNVTSEYAEYNLKPLFTYPTIDNLSSIGDFWEKPITVNWRSTYQDGFEYECYYNNNKVKSGEGNKEKTFTIPANTFSGTLPSSVRIRVYRLYGENKYYSEWREKSLSLQDIEAKISNLIVTGNYWEDDITFSWQSSDQQQFKIEVWKDNILQHTYTGTIATRYTIPKNTLTAGAYLFKVWVGYANRFVNNQSKNITLKDIIPTLDNLSLSGSNIDYNLILTWDSTYQSKAEIEIYKESDKLNTITLNQENKYVIANNTLSTGAYTFKVRVSYTSATGDRWSDFKSINVTLIESFPTIGALQPDGTVRDKDKDIEVWWTSQNQTRYTLKVGSYTYSGGTEKSHIIPAGTFTDTGEVIITLEIIHVTSNQVEKKAEKKTKFILAGKPSMPTITSSSQYAYNRPVITWDSVGQQGFICTVEDVDNNVIWSSDWQNGLINRIKCMEYLKNGIYKAKVQIMNNTLERSEIAVAQLTVHSIETVNIELSIEDVEYGKKLLWANPDDYYQAFYIIRNDQVIAKTTNLEYYDYTCQHGESTYIVRGVTGNDTYKDSNTLTTRLRLPYGTLATVSIPEDCIDAELQRNDYTHDMSHTLNSTVIYLNGRENPVVVIGEHITEEYIINFVSNDCDKFITMCDRKETFVYRNRQGNVLFLSITNPQLNKDKFGAVYSCTGLKVDYKEVIYYD
jgi:hypothetical protein